MPISKAQINRCVGTREYGEKKVILFGRALEKPEKVNEVDLAYEGIEGWRLFEFGARLEESILVPVDLVPLTPVNCFTSYVEKKDALPIT